VKDKLENQIIIGGVYLHFKGNHYKLLHIAKCSETEKDLMVYQALYGDKEVWVRSLEMFLEEVENEGKKVPRFQFLGYDY
jgi:cyclomaltodextrinase / maltogenic alpha-amylase / neopullulanase